MKNRLFLILFGFFGALSLASASNEPISIHGAGATFPYPLYSKWFSEFQKVDPRAEINYQSIGSGGGVRQLMEHTIDFGATDIPMKDDQLKKASEPIFHFPMTLGAVVLTYNLPEIQGSELKLTPALVSDLFLGKIYYWNDARIQEVNPGLKLPDVPVMIVHRSDGSGTTAVFTDYLAKVSPEWKTKVGAGTNIKWPIGLGGKGNEGVTGFVKHSPGALGYVELLYAEKNHLSVAALQNQKGFFIRPSTCTITEAAKGKIKDIPTDFRVSITDSPADQGYPISSFTYLLLYESMDSKKGTHLKQFMEWAFKEGQGYAESLYYAPLPKELTLRARTALTKILLKNSAGKNEEK